MGREGTFSTTEDFVDGLSAAKEPENLGLGWFQGLGLVVGIGVRRRRQVIVDRGGDILQK